MAQSRYLKIMGVALTLSALTGPTAAIASGSPAYTPLVALSMVASPQSQAALCATASAGVAEASATAAAATQAPPVQGCVLPVADAPPAPLPPQAAAAPGGFSPLLIGIGAIGLGVLLYALLHNDKNQAPPEPESPA